MYTVTIVGCVCLHMHQHGNETCLLTNTRAPATPGLRFDDCIQAAVSSRTAALPGKLSENQICPQALGTGEMPVKQHCNKPSCYSHVIVPQGCDGWRFAKQIRRYFKEEIPPQLKGQRRY